MAARLLLVAAVANAVFAYSNTAPVVAWSSSSSSALDSLPSHFDTETSTLSLLESLFNADNVCDHDAIVIVDQPGLHASDLRTLSSNTHIARSLSSSASSRQYPYIPADSELDLTAVAERVSSKCQSRLLQYSPGQSDVTLEHGTKHVLCLGMPHLNQSGKARKEAMSNHEAELAMELQALAATFPDHLVVYTGSPLRLPFFKRQSPDIPDRPVLDLSQATQPLSSSFAANTTLPDGGILKRYQILTPGLIMGLLVSFFVLVPVLYLALSALSTIQIPIRSDVGKTFNALEKKNQ